MEKDKVRVDKIFNRLRARLYNMVEQMDLGDTQLDSYKKTIKDITAAAWNDCADMITDKESEEREDHDKF